MISIKLRILLRIIQCCQYTFISSFLSANLHNILYVPGFKFIFPTPFTVIYCVVFPHTLEYNSQFIDTCWKAKVSKEVLKCSKLLPFTTLKFISVQTMLCLIIFLTTIPPSVLICNLIYLFFILIYLLLFVVISQEELHLAPQTDPKTQEGLSELLCYRDFVRLELISSQRGIGQRSRSEPFFISNLNSSYKMCHRYTCCRTCADSGNFLLKSVTSVFSSFCKTFTSGVG